MKTTKNIILAGYVENIYHAIKNSKFFVLTSEWEDPGFVLMESAIIGTPIISSDCESGPRELIKENVNGFVFKSNDLENFLEKFELYKNIDIKKLKKIVLQAKLLAKKFTIFSHFKTLDNLLI